MKLTFNMSNFQRLVLRLEAGASSPASRSQIQKLCAQKLGVGSAGS